MVFKRKGTQVFRFCVIIIRCCVEIYLLILKNKELKNKTQHSISTQHFTFPPGLDSFGQAFIFVRYIFLGIFFVLYFSYNEIQITEIQSGYFKNYFM